MIRLVLDSSRYWDGDTLFKNLNARLKVRIELNPTLSEMLVMVIFVYLSKWHALLMRNEFM